MVEIAVHEYPRNHGSLAGLTGTDHHTQYAVTVTGTAAARPNPSRLGTLYVATDTGAVSLDLGTSWQSVFDPTTSPSVSALTQRVADLETLRWMEVSP